MMAVKNFDPHIFSNLEAIGKGHYSIVYKANMVSLGKTVALKIVDKRVTTRKTMMEEVRALQQLQSKCANVLCYVDFMEDEQNYYIVTEYEGHLVTLAEFLREHQQLDLVNIFTIFENLKRGLIDFHRLGIVHRDIKPANILIDPETLKTKYIDFGLACTQIACNQKAMLGTPKYMAPEFWHGKDKPRTIEQWFKADFWALGSILVELMCGTAFYRAVYERIKDPAMDQPHLPIKKIATYLMEGPPIADFLCFHPVTDTLFNNYLELNTRSMLNINPKSRKMYLHETLEGGTVLWANPYRAQR
jgi:serine/threonine-protein kinase